MPGFTRKLTCNSSRLFLLLIILPFLSAAGKFRSDSLKVKKGIEAFSTFSLPGFAAGAGFFLSHRKCAYTLRVKCSITHLVRGASIPAGGGAGFRYTLAAGKNLSMGMDIAYENFFIRLNSPYKKNKYTYQAHELYCGYFLQLRIAGFILSHCFSYGMLAELHDHFNAKGVEYFFHGGPYTRLSIAFGFN